MGSSAQTFYKRLADLLSHKRHVPYSSIIGWLRCKLSFAILRSAVLCIRGSRSSIHHPIKDINISPACSRGLCAQACINIIIILLFDLLIICFFYCLFMSYLFFCFVYFSFICYGLSQSVKVSFQGSGRANTKIVAGLRPFERCMDSRLHVDPQKTCVETNNSTCQCRTGKTAVSLLNVHVQ